MEKRTLIGEVVRYLPHIPRLIWEVLVEWVEDFVRFFVRPRGVQWPEPSAAARL
jgi:hypothetical protein